jgi:hypothetical protein
MENLKGLNRSGLTEILSWYLPGVSEEKQRYTSIGITAVPAEIRTKEFQNASVEIHHFTVLFGQ